MILCCGEALIDMLPRTTAVGAAAYQPAVGGAVFNTAIALGRLDRRAGLLTGLSTDLFGRMLEAALSESGVRTDHALRSDRPTTLAFVELTDGQARYVFYDEASAGRMITAEALPDLPDDIGAMFFGGISLIGEPCGTAFEALMARETARRLTMLDPNIRPGFVRDEAAYRARLTRMVALADIVKVSDEDLRWLAGDDAIEPAARRLLATGPRLICVTCGAEGAWGYSDREAVFQPSGRVTVSDTVGAGDTFNAGVLAALDRAGHLTKDAVARLDAGAIAAALDLASRAAAVTVSRPGADPPWASELA